jgi:hypothetical protein
MTDRLPGTEVIVLDEFLDPLGENLDVEEPDVSDIIVHFSEENKGRGIIGVRIARTTRTNIYSDYRWISSRVLKLLNICIKLFNLPSTKRELLREIYVI